MKVIEFPKRVKHNKPTKFTELETKMNQVIKLLDMQHAHIKEQYAKLRAMEAECGRTEQKYNQLLIDYAERKGAENVSLKYMNYGSNIKTTLNPEGGITLEIEK